MILFNNIYFSLRFFIALGVIVILFILSFTYPRLFVVSQWALGLLSFLTLLDLFLCHRQTQQVFIDRQIPDKLSLGDHQDISYDLSYSGALPLRFQIYDEYPVQLQYRELIGSGRLDGHEGAAIKQSIRPTERGDYVFNAIRLFLSTPLHLIEYRKTVQAHRLVHVFPSIIQMKKYELEVFAKTAQFSGIRRVRQLGENDEFEHIRSYTPGDNIRSINWKATARNNELMVNQFQNTRSQNVYMLLDKGRSMKMPFNELSLLDYAINSCLVLSNIVLKKYDKTGLISFSHEIDSIVPAGSRDHQLERVLQALYAQETGYLESNFPALFTTIRRQIKKRSILILFTNFEHELDMQRALPYLRNINRSHILVVILFRNTELEKLTEARPATRQEIYLKTMGQRLIMDKEKIAERMRARGINTILTRPEDLSTEVINAYLKIKARHMQ